MATNAIKPLFNFPMFQTKELAKKPCKEVFGLDESRQWASSTLPAVSESKKQLENGFLNSNRVRREHLIQLNIYVSEDKFHCFLFNHQTSDKYFSMSFNVFAKHRCKLRIC